MPENTRGEGSPPALPEGSEFDGVLLASGPARIEGRVYGPVIGTHSIEIGATAQVFGGVEAPQIRVAGQVAGDLVASERVELVSGARIAGAIATPRLLAEDGAQIDGSARVGALRAPRDEPS
jgi:cytoskeletal protein CcmA (bactofilin family)